LYNDKKYQRQPEQIQLELNSNSEINAIINKGKLERPSEFSRFYVITYEIDDESKLISRIELDLLNPSTMSLELVTNLTEYIKTSRYTITAEQTGAIVNEKVSENSMFSGDENAFGYYVPEVEKKSKGNNGGN